MGTKPKSLRSSFGQPSSGKRHRSENATQRHGNLPKFSEIPVFQLLRPFLT